jgi:uncharacterized protein (TIGR02001 family)
MTKVLNVNKKIIAAALLLGSSATPAVEFTGNAGAVSEYVFRGVPQTDGKAAAQGGLDLGFNSGFYLGTWGSSVKSDSDNGVEVDLYGGWGGGWGDFSYGLGGTYYTYTNDFDEDYVEAILNAGWKWFSVDVAVGEYDSKPTKADYSFASLTAEHNGLYATYGSFSQDFDGAYVELGYGSTLSVAGEDLFDYSISFVRSEDKLIGELKDGNSLIFGITKNFTIK